MSAALRRSLGVLVSLIALISVVVTGVLVARRTDQRPSTHDAYIQAYIVNMAPEVSGHIIELNVLDNQQVKEGEVLFQIDPKPFQLRVDQARAAVQGLEAQVALTTSEVASQTSGAEAAATGINTAEAQLALATSNLDRLQPLLKRGFVMAEQVDQARTAKQTAQIALERARQLAAQARQAITSTKPTQAQLDGARATLALAERDLNKTAVRSPSNGRITALQVANGEFANAGHPLFTIIDTKHWYAIGNFRETDLGGIKPGQHATVFVMAQPDLPLRGTVDSLGWGVASDVSATFGGLPHIASTLNWVRIAARFPVRVLLDEPPQDLMRLGASAVIEIEK
jgi:membrane fusion protein, multidrug efflux system